MKIELPPIVAVIASLAVAAVAFAMAADPAGGAFDVSAGEHDWPLATPMTDQGSESDLTELASVIPATVSYTHLTLPTILLV